MSCTVEWVWPALQTSGLLYRAGLPSTASGERGGWREGGIWGGREGGREGGSVTCSDMLCSSDNSQSLDRVLLEVGVHITLPRW